MPPHDKSDDALAAELAEISRTFANRRLELARIEEQMKALSAEIKRRLDAARDGQDEPLDSD